MSNCNTINYFPIFSRDKFCFNGTQSTVFIQVSFVDFKERAKAIGWYGITQSIAAIIGKILGGFLAETNYLIKG